MKSSICYLLLVLSVSAMDQGAVPFERVFDVISAPQIYVTTWDNLLRQLKPWCKASARPDLELIEFGNIECRDEVNVRSMTASTGTDRRVSMLTASFRGSSKCSYMRTRLTKAFGKPSSVKGECGLEWRVRTPKGQPQRYVGMDASIQEDKVYFSIGEEQGP